MPDVVHTIKQNANTSAEPAVHHLHQEAIVAEVRARVAELQARIAERDAQIAEVTYDRDCWRDAALTWRRIHSFEAQQAKRLAERAAARKAG